MSTRPPCRLPTSIFTVASETGGGFSGFFGAATAPAGSAKTATVASRDERRFTRAGTLLAQQGETVVQHVQHDPRQDRAGLLVEQREDEAEDDQRRHRRHSRQRVEAAEDESGDERGGDPGEAAPQAAEQHPAEANLLANRR